MHDTCSTAVKEQTTIKQTEDQIYSNGNTGYAAYWFSNDTSFYCNSCVLFFLKDPSKLREKHSWISMWSAAPCSPVCGMMGLVPGLAQAGGGGLMTAFVPQLLPYVLRPIDSIVDANKKHKQKIPGFAHPDGYNSFKTRGAC